MSDLIQRLNRHALPDPHDEREVLHAPLLREAAAEIERLNVMYAQVIEGQRELQALRKNAGDALAASQACHRDMQRQRDEAIAALRELVRTAEQLPIAATVYGLAQREFYPALDTARRLLNQKEGM